MKFRLLLAAVTTLIALPGAAQTPDPARMTAQRQGGRDRRAAWGVRFRVRAAAAAQGRGADRAVTRPVSLPDGVS